MENKILDMYFKKRMKQIDIANKLGVSKYKVSRVIAKDPRSKEEKENRKIANKKKNIEYTKSYMKQKWANREQDSYAVVNNMHDQAVRELSGSRNHISNRAFRNWNSSIYKYNEETKSYVLKKGITVGADVPRRIDWRGV